MQSLVTTAPPKSREEFVAKAREEAAERYGRTDRRPVTGSI